MLPIKDILFKVVQQKGLKKQLESVEVVKIANHILKEAFNNNIKASFFIKNTLWIQTSSPVLANEIFLNKERLKNEINKKIGKNLVKEIKVKNK